MPLMLDNASRLRLGEGQAEQILGPCAFLLQFTLLGFVGRFSYVFTAVVYSLPVSFVFGEYHDC